MAKPQETRQEQETRWAAQRAAREQDFHTGQQARRRKTRRTWVIVAVLVLLAAGIAVAMLL
jgi:DNA-binding LacI/PurR family transcriptional regulator